MTTRMWSRRPTALFGALALAVGGAVTAGAQTTAGEFRAAFASGDSTTCMEAGNAASEFKHLAKELAAPLFEVVAEGGVCAGNALSGLVNLGPGIVEGIGAEAALPMLMAAIEKGIDVEYGEPASRAQSALFVIGYFEERAAPAVPLVERWLLERTEASDRRYALMTLGEIGNPAQATVPTLLELMAPSDDDSWERQEVRNEVFRILGSIPAAAEQTGPALVEALSSEDWTVASLAQDALVELGEPVVPMVLKELDAPSDERRERAVTILQEMGPAAAAAATKLVSLLGDENWNVGYEAKVAVENIGPSEGVIAALVAVATTSDSEDARTSAMEVLGFFGAAASGALPALRELATSDDWSLRNAAQQAIEMIEATE